MRRVQQIKISMQKQFPSSRAPGQVNRGLWTNWERSFYRYLLFFRLNMESGYSPRDPEITKFIRQSSTPSGIHNVIVSLLAGALFEGKILFLVSQ